MISSIKPLQQQVVMDYLLKELAIYDSAKLSSKTDLLVAEYIRYLVVIETERGTPIHTNRIIGQVVNRLTSLVSSNVNDNVLADVENNVIARVLERLITLREIEHIGRGYHIPTSTRLVRLPSGNGLIISGLPTKELAKLHRGIRALPGLCRAVREEDIPEFIQSMTAANRVLSIEDFESWLDLFRYDIYTWTTKKMSQFQSKFKTTTSTVDDIEIYDPTSNKHNLQVLCWQNPDNSWFPGPEALVLCRTKRRPRRYWIGKFALSNHKILLSFECDIPLNITKRLHFGIDAISGNPTIVQIIEHNTNFELVLPNGLPDEELRFLLAVGEEVSDGKLPVRFLISNEFGDDVLKLVKDLGLKMKVRRGN